MAKRWTEKEDAFLHFYFEGVGDFIGEHDLGRPRGAATRRVAHLKATGAWAALDKMEAAQLEYRRCLGLSVFDGEEIETEAKYWRSPPFAEQPATDAAAPGAPGDSRFAGGQVGQGPSPQTRGS